MKKLVSCYFVMAVAVSMISCGSGEVKVQKDSFSGENVATTMLRHPVETKGFSGAKIVYTKVLDSAKPIQAAVVIKGPETAVVVKGEATVKVGDATFTSSIEDSQENIKEDTYGTIVGADDDVAIVSSFKTRQKVMGFKFTIDEKAQNAISGGSKCLVRVFSGKTPVVIIIENDKLKSLKDFIAFMKK